MTENDTDSKYLEMTADQLRELLRKTSHQEDAERISKILQQRREQELVHKAELKKLEPTSNDKMKTETITAQQQSTNDDGSVWGMIIIAAFIGWVLLGLWL